MMLRGMLIIYTVTLKKRVDGNLGCKTPIPYMNKDLETTTLMTSVTRAMRVDDVDGCAGRRSWR